MADRTLLKLWREWQQAIGARAYGRRSLIEAKIAQTPASSIIGVGVKLAVFAHANCHDDAATVQAMSAYEDAMRLAQQTA